MDTIPMTEGSSLSAPRKPKKMKVEPESTAIPTTPIPAREASEPLLDVLTKENESFQQQLTESQQVVANLKQSRQLMENNVLDLQRQRDKLAADLTAAHKSVEQLGFKNSELERQLRNFDSRVRDVEQRERVVAEKEKRPAAALPPAPATSPVNDTRAKVLEAQLEILREEQKFLRELCLCQAKGPA